MVLRRVPIESELSRAESPFAGMTLEAPVASAQVPQEPREEGQGGDAAPEIRQPVEVATRESGLAGLSNLFNSPRKIQVASALPGDMYLAICRREGGIPKFFRDAMETDLDPYGVMLGAKEIAVLRKAGRVTVTPKIEVAHYERIKEIAAEATVAGVGMITEAKVVAGIFYVHAKRQGLI